MSKIIDYPRGPLKSCLDIAQAVDALGGRCSNEMAADKLNKKVSGAWQALVGSATRYGLIYNKKGTLETTTLYRNYKLAYSKDEASIVLTQAFLMPPLFKNIFERFQGRELPISHFEKLLIREFGVPDQISSRVAKYFLEGAKQCGLLGANNLLSAPSSFREEAIDTFENDSESTNSMQENAKTGQMIETQDELKSQESLAEDGKFSVRIKGPGMDSVIVVNDEEDLLIIKAMIKKVEKKFALKIEDEL